MFECKWPCATRGLLPCNHRRFDRERAGAAHRIDEGLCAVVVDCKQTGGGDRLAQRRFRYRLSVAASVQQLARCVGAHRHDVVHDAHEDALCFIGRCIVVIAVGEPDDGDIDAKVLRNLTHHAFSHGIRVIEARLAAGHSHRHGLTRQQHLLPRESGGAFLQFRETLRLELTKPHDHARCGTEPEVRERDGVKVRQERDTIRRRRVVWNTEGRELGSGDRRDAGCGDREGRPGSGHSGNLVRCDFAVSAWVPSSSNCLRRGQRERLSRVCFLGTGADGVLDIHRSLLLARSNWGNRSERSGRSALHAQVAAARQTVF